MPQHLVSEVIRSNSFIAVSATTTVREVAHLMKTHHTSAVLVTDTKHALLGVCTERDMVVKVLAADLEPASTTMDAVMTRNPIAITADKPFVHALHIMYEGGFRHVPVVDEFGRPIGLLSARDALNLDAHQLEADLVRREEITVIL